MTVRKPIVRSGGKLEQMKSGDRLSSTPTVRLTDAMGVRHYLPLDEDGNVVFMFSDGSLDSIPTIKVIK